MDQKARFKLDIRLYIFCTLVLFTLCACARSHTSDLRLSIDKSAVSSSFSQSLALKALNKNARQAVIEDSGKSSIMFFAFDDTASQAGVLRGEALQSPMSLGSYALELELESLPSRGGTASRQTARRNDGQNAEKEGRFFFGFIYEKDIASASLRSFEKNRHSIGGQKGIRASIPLGAHFTVSLSFEGSENAASSDIRGFMIYSDVPLAVRGAKITRARYGFRFSDGRPFFGFSASGGSIPVFAKDADTVPQKLVFPPFSQLSPLAEDECRELYIHFRPAGFDAAKNNSAGYQAAGENRIELLCGTEKLTIFRRPSMHSAVIDMRTFTQDFNTVEVLSGSSDIEGIVMEQKKLPAFAPITADPGLIVDWPHKNVRNAQFELFSWQAFPSVLIFDCADYAVQDAFFKRLAFFVEKKGYAGKLLSDEAISAFHGFNAHDYRAESLASFFDKAEKEGFPLNSSELFLRDILFANGVILRNAQDIVPGKGAVISISRESSRYLRHLFITHEGLHGIYFTEARFKDYVDGIFHDLAKRDPKALAFVRRYFEVTPSLNYNTDDDYLLKNEFMAYLLQQKTDAVASYFTETLSKRRFISAAEPELCGYIRETQARSLTEAARAMSKFLYKNWGVEGGRLFSMQLN